MSSQRSGFTLIELMVVVIIIAALAGMVLPKVLPASDEAKAKIAQGSIAGIETGLDLYRLHNDRYPGQDEGLNALLVRTASARNWNGPYLKKKPMDPWKRPFQYRYPGVRNASGPDVWALGPDGQNGTEDDVWAEE